MLGVLEGVLVGVMLGVLEGVLVGVMLGVLEGVLVGVCVGVGVGVGLGVGTQQQNEGFAYTIIYYPHHPVIGFGAMNHSPPGYPVGMINVYVSFGTLLTKNPGLFVSS